MNKNQVLETENNTPLDNFYNSVKKFFLKEFGSKIDPTQIDKMEKYYDEMKSQDMNKIIKEAELCEEQRH